MGDPNICVDRSFNDSQFLALFTFIYLCSNPSVTISEASSLVTVLPSEIVWYPLISNSRFVLKLRILQPCQDIHST